MTLATTVAASPPVAGLLVVDDHELVRLGLQTLVQAQAAANQTVVKVFEARTLQGALDVYRNEQACIGLVLLDLHLPDAHGLSGLTSFLAQFPDAPVVVLSGASDPALMRQALAHGARAYLTKLRAMEIRTKMQAESLKDDVNFYFHELKFLERIVPGFQQLRLEGEDLIRAKFEDL